MAKRSLSDYMRLFGEHFAWGLFIFLVLRGIVIALVVTLCRG